MNGDIERLAIAQAVYSELGKMVKAGGDGLRGDIDRELMSDYASKGVDRYRLPVNGQNVGTLSIRFGKETMRCYIEDTDALTSWFMEDGGDDLERFIKENESTVASWLAKRIEKTGELPDGCVGYVEPPAPTGTTIKVDSEKVATALGMTLPQAVVHLLGGEVE